VVLCHRVQLERHTIVHLPCAGLVSCIAYRSCNSCVVLLCLLYFFSHAVFVVSCVASTCVFFFSSRRRHTRSKRDWSSDVCSSDLGFASSSIAITLQQSVQSPHCLPGAVI